MKKKQIFALLATYLGYCSIYIARVNLSVAGPFLTGDGYLSATQFGVLGSAFSVCYAVGRLASGRFNDRVAPWKMLVIGLGAAGVANLLLGLLPPYAGMLVLCAANALGQSMLWGSVLHVVVESVDEQIVKRIMSYMVTAVSTGTVLGYLLDARWTTRYGVGATFLLPGALCLLLAAACFVFTKHIRLPAPPPSQKTRIRGLFTVQDGVGVLLPDFLHGLMKDNISLWLPAFFVSAYGLDLQNAVWYVVLVPLVGLVGRLLYSPLYELLRQNERSVNLVSFAICLAGALRLLLGNLSMLEAAICFGLMYAALSLANTSYLSIYPLGFQEKGSTAFVSGVMDLLAYLGAGVGSALFGRLIDRAGYSSMFAVWTGISLAAVLLSLIVRRKEKKHEAASAS